MNNYKKYGEYSAERCSRGETVKTAIAFFVTGAGVGALLSLLLAPRSGPEVIDSTMPAVSWASKPRVCVAGQPSAGQAREKVLPIRKTR